MGVGRVAFGIGVVGEGRGSHVIRVILKNDKNIFFKGHCLGGK